MSRSSTNHWLGKGAAIALIAALLWFGVSAALRIPGPIRKIKVQNAPDAEPGSLEYFHGRDRNGVMRRLLGSHISWEPCTSDEFEALNEGLGAVVEITPVNGVGSAVFDVRPR